MGIFLLDCKQALEYLSYSMTLIFKTIAFYLFKNNKFFAVGVTDVVFVNK